MNNETMTRADINAHFIYLLQDYPFERALKKFLEDMKIFRATGRLDEEGYNAALEIILNIYNRNMFEEEAK